MDSPRTGYPSDYFLFSRSWTRSGFILLLILPEPDRNQIRSVTDTATVPGSSLQDLVGSRVDIDRNFYIFGRSRIGARYVLFLVRPEPYFYISYSSTLLRNIAEEIVFKLLSP